MFRQNYRKPFDIIMTEGDWGITLPIVLDLEDGEQLGVNDEFQFKIYNKVNGTLILQKEYTNIENNTINFELTEQETTLLPVGEYVYDLDWINTEQFQCNLIAKEKYVVEEKAGVISDSETRNT